MNNFEFILYFVIIPITVGVPLGLLIPWLLNKFIFSPRLEAIKRQSLERMASAGCDWAKRDLKKN